MASINFPNVNFDWLGRLPLIAQEGESYKARQSTLADLSSDTSIEGLERKGAKLMALGDPESVKAGLALLGAASQRRSIAQRGEEFRAYQAGLPGMLKALQEGRTTGPAAPTEGMPLIEPLQPPGPESSLPATPVASAAPPTQLAGDVVPLPIQPGPQAGPPNATERMQGYGNPRVPMITPQSPGGYDNINRQFNATPPGPRGADLSPSDQILASAEGGGQPPALAPTQVAQAGPGPAPVQGPPRPAPQPLPGPPPSDQAKMQNLFDFLVAAGRRTTPLVAAKLAEFKDLLAESKMTPEQKNYYVDYVQALQAGERPPANIAAWRAEQKTLPESFKEMQQKGYAPIADRAEKAVQTRDVYLGMRELARNPEFNQAIPGNRFQRGTEGWDNAMRVLNGLAQTVKSYGGPDWTDRIAKVSTSTQLREVFDTLSKQVVTQGNKLGGQSFSNPDREYIDKTIPNIHMTAASRDLLIDLGLAKADRDIQIRQIADQVRERKGARTTVTDINRAVDKFTAENPMFRNKDGTLTPLGERIQGQTKPAGPYQHLEGQSFKDEKGRRFKIINGNQVFQNGS